MTNLIFDQETKTARLSLTGDLTVFHVESLRERFLEAVEIGEQMELDLTRLEGVDVAGLQMLLATHKSLHRENKRLTVRGQIPQFFRQVVQQSGFSGCIKNDDSGLWMGVDD